jgi:serine/threonine-protein kinase
MAETVTVSSSQRPDESGAEHDGFPQVFGKYVLLRSMARGGMGELFIAAAGETGGFEKLCVVKKVLHNLEDAGVHRRFLDEAKVVVRLNHANLVQVFDAGRVENEYYLAMELVEGKDLRAVWNRCAQLHRRIPVDFAIFVMREVARGLDYVHEAKNLDLVHRDISPPNILIGYHGEVKLTDFGLAKSALKREMTRPGVVFGRYSYLSPEQARGLSADRRTDIYAAGIVLWELLTGRQLFPSGDRSHKEALAAVRNPVVEAPSKIVPGIPPGLDEIVLQALAKEVKSRYGGAGELRAGLSEVLNRHFPTCDVDRVSDFMKEIFAREYRLERKEAGAFLRRDFSEIRALAEASDAISISDIIFMPSGSTESGTIPLEEADIVELDEPASQFGEPDLRMLRAQARSSLGRVIGQRYRTDAIIGIGGMGAVYSATHLALGKSFALKILHPAYTRDAGLIARFMREARAASQTGHPNIVDVVDVGTSEDGDVYFAMELLEGQDLRSVISRAGPLAVRRAVHIARQVCKALSAAHEAGIIHRDLKSENIFLTPRGKDPDFVKVLDFGICKQVGAAVSDTSPGIVIGSPGYMAPEQGTGQDASTASDVYAVGCILYEMLAGALPFVGDSPIDVIQKKTSTDAPPVTVARPEVPEPLAQVVARCLQRRPEDRPASMRALEYELTRAVDGRASAVAAVLGLNVPQEERGSSARMARAAILPRPSDRAAAVSAADSVADLQTLDVTKKHVRKRPGPAAPQGSAVAGLKALLFVGLGGLLAAGVVLGLSPELVDRIAGRERAAAEEPTTASSRSVPAVPAAQPAPPSAIPQPAQVQPMAPGAADPAVPALVPVPAGTDAADTAAAPGTTAAPEPGTTATGEPVEKKAGEPDVAAMVARADKALAEQRWREPPDGSLALELMNIGLVDPGNEAIGRLRREAGAQLLPVGEKALKKKQWMDAARAFRDLVAVWPDNGEAREQLAEALLKQGRVLRRLKDHEGALATADELLNLAPSSFKALLMRADALAALERWEEAKAAYAAAKKEKPRSKSAKKGYRRAGLEVRRRAREAARDGG